MQATQMNRPASLVTIVVLLAVCGFFGPKVSPEMKAVIDAFGDRAQRTEVLARYAAPGVVPVELTQCDMSKPVVIKAQAADGIIVYTLESRVEKCEHSEAAAGTVRVFDMGWQDGKIVRFAWQGPKSGKVEY
jgi:hypothetical protein